MTAPRGNALKRLPRCRTCGYRIRTVRTSKRCPACKETKPVSMWPHHAGRADHLGPYCESCKRQRDRKDTPKRRTRKGPRRVPTDLAALLASNLRDDRIIGRFKSEGWAYGWVEVPGASEPVVLPLKIDDQHLYQVTDAYFDDGEEDPDARVYEGEGGTLSYSHSDPASGLTEGAKVAVVFDAEGNAEIRTVAAV